MGLAPTGDLEMSKRARPDLSKAIQRSASSEAAENALIQQQTQRQLVPLEKITDRPIGDTRPLNPAHIKELVDSIAVIGLITPLTVDRRYRLLAGAHRRAALQRLAEKDPKQYSELFDAGIPVHIMDIDAEIDTVDALQIEVEENTQRRNYTASEIREAAQKLENAGYEKIRGRPAKGQKSLNRELMSVFRLSRRRITDILNEPEGKSAHLCSLFDDLKKYKTYLKRTERFKTQITSKEETPELQRVQRDLNKLIKDLKTLVDHTEANIEE